LKTYGGRQQVKFVHPGDHLDLQAKATPCLLEALPDEAVEETDRWEVLSASETHRF
jgi:hypothetical protein